MKKKEHTSCINLVPIFNHLDKESQSIIASKAFSKELKRNEFLYQAGDLDDSLYIVHKGQIRITHLAESGKEQLIRLLNPGEFTGEWTIFSDTGYHEHYAQATRNTNVCTIRRKDLEELLKEYPGISTEILKTMANRLQESQKQTASIATEEVTNRIIYYLEDLAQLNEEDETTIKLPMSRKDLASYLGTTPETISRRFKELEAEGLIKQLAKNNIHIPSVEELMFAAL
ncbi:MAG: Crp/Fnr family transcriptional regulator [Atopostipes suicloacalis]|nr:Crp/Fnr family transcriptional regulator [Atopostipes suicloacalis]MDN6730936.1 Crp/Fnr family transcriptional regulator [Atopostipes suicloacalis]